MAQTKAQARTQSKKARKGNWAAEQAAKVNRAHSAALARKVAEVAPIATEGDMALAKGIRLSEESALREGLLKDQALKELTAARASVRAAETRLTKELDRLAAYTPEVAVASCATADRIEAQAQEIAALKAEVVTVRADAEATIAKALEANEADRAELMAFKVADGVPPGWMVKRVRALTEEGTTLPRTLVHEGKKANALWRLTLQMVAWTIDNSALSDKGYGHDGVETPTDEDPKVEEASDVTP